MAALHLLHTSQILAIFALGKEKVAPSKNWPPLRIGPLKELAPSSLPEGSTTAQPAS